MSAAGGADGTEVVSTAIPTRELHARERRLQIAHNRFVAWLAWFYRDQPGDPAYDFTELLAGRYADDGSPPPGPSTG